MASYIKTLKEDNGDITYPQTLASAVFTSGGSDVESEMGKYVTATDIASTAEIDLSVLLSKFYPVGSIYMSATMSTTSQVEAALGGTWVAWGAGRVPVGVDTNDTDFDTAEWTGGEKTVALTVDEIPSHDHESINWTSGYTGGSQAGFKTLLEGNSSTTGVKACQATGGGQSHNNLQPYITCYMYKRTA